jgi:hypothetical protein
MAGSFLKYGTSLERTAPESLTRIEFNFVHGHIWPAASPSPLDRVEPFFLIQIYALK